MRLGLATTLGGAVLAALSGCASSVYEGKYAWEDGWREAKVVRVGPSAGLGGRHSTDCRYGQASQPQSERYVVLSYRNMSRERRAVVPAPADIDVQVGEPVYANIRSCVASTVVRRVARGDTR